MSHRAAFILWVSDDFLVVQDRATWKELADLGSAPWGPEIAFFLASPVTLIIRFL